MNKNFLAGKEYFYEIELRGSRRAGLVLAGVVGLGLDYMLSDSKNNGSMQFIEINREKAMSLFNDCLEY